MARLEAQFSVEVLAPSLVWVGDPNLSFAIEQNISAPFTLEIENTGPSPVTYQFTASWTDGVDFSVTLDDNLYTRTVEPGETDVLAGRVHVGEVEPGPGYEISITIE